jgi:SAM-dependent methyltransferase
MKLILQNLAKQIAHIYVNTPFYPYWLKQKEEKKRYDIILKDLASHLEGKTSLSLLEIGCGHQRNKPIFLEQLPILHYYGLEYPQWLMLDRNVTNTEFYDANDTHQKDSILQKAKEAIFGNLNINAIKADIWGDGLKLPFRDDSFDIIAHSQVLEHVSSPELLFQEISRCLKKEGYLLFDAPFLCQIHTAFDISRLTEQGTDALCQKFGLERITYSSTNFGATLSQLTNSFIIKNVVRFYDDSSSLIRKIITAILASIFLFPIVNVVGFFVDKIWPDNNFANNYFFIYKKL